jgi:hypothetical protein
MRTFELAAVDDLQVGPVPFCLHDRGLPLPGEILEAVGVEQRHVELATLARHTALAAFPRRAMRQLNAILNARRALAHGRAVL